MKKIAAFLGIVGLILTSLASFVASASFTDVTQDDFYYDAVTFLEEKGIVSGYGDGSFGYSLPINRAELLTIVIKAMDQEKLPDSAQWIAYAGENCFTDVPANQWYTQYVCYAKDVGWVAGYPDGSFKPGQAVNFVEVLKIAMGGLEVEYQTGTSPWYKGVVDSASEKNLIPLTINSFGQEITRGEMCDIIARILKYQAGELGEWLGEMMGYVVTYETIEAGESVYEQYDDVCGVDDCAEAENKVEFVDYSAGVKDNGLGYYIELEVDEVDLGSGQDYYAECWSDKGLGGGGGVPDVESTDPEITVYFVEPETEYSCHVLLNAYGPAEELESTGIVKITTPDESEGLETYTDDYVGITLKYPIGADIEVTDESYSDWFGKVLTINVPELFGEGLMRVTGHKLNGFYGYNAYSPMGADMGGLIEIGGRDFMSYYSDSVYDMGGLLDLPYTNYVYGSTDDPYRWIEIEMYIQGDSDVSSYLWSIIDTLELEDW